MTNPAKKNEKVFRRLIDFRRLHIISRRVYVIGFVCLIALLILASAGIYMQSAMKSDKNNVIQMRESVAELINRLKTSNSKTHWKNDSSCAASQPKSFNEDVNYSCNALYTFTQSITNQQDLDGLVHDITTVLNSSSDIVHEVNDNSTGSVKIENPSTENSYYSATTFVLNDVRMDGELCFVRYIIAGARSSVEVFLECKVDTKKAYFEPIKRS